jgi:CheY-like chemotaxis protein
MEENIDMDYDPERLLQIVHNLLSNAIKFTPSGGRIRMLVRSTDKAGSQEQLEFSVIDTGMGIPESDLPKVFDRFYQASNQHEGHAGGSGIGLALTKELLRAMGGDIAVESKVGVGSVFTATLPITRKANKIQPNLADQRLPVQAPVAGAPIHPADLSLLPDLPLLLIIEDNIDVIAYLRLCLSDFYRLDYAYNGRAGIEKALDVSPDIIISDVMMPEKDGLEVCDTLKNDARTSHIPIVLLTAKATVRDRISGLRKGADAYLAKPFNQEELQAQLEILLTNQARMREYYTRIALSDASQPDPAAVLPPEDAFLTKLRGYMQDNLSKAGLSPDDICRVMGMGRTNLYKKLHALTGMSVTEYLRMLRLRKAQELLRTSTLNISEVAYEVGYDDPKYFSRVFSEEFGQPPSAFRAS